MDEEPNQKQGATPRDKSMVDTPATALTEASMCSEESTSAADSTTVVVPTSAAGLSQQRVLMQRSLLNHQALVFTLLSSGSFGAFLFLSLPFWALVALLFFVGSTCAMFYMGYRIVLLEWNNLMAQRGIGDYLPASIYQQLTTTSVHEWLMDGSFFLENRYLLLYFIPGITQEQLDSYLERLPARHQYILTRPGLGQFLGQDFMRLVMGQGRYNELLLEDEREEEVIERGTSSSRRLFEGENNGEDESSNSNSSSHGLRGGNQPLARPPSATTMTVSSRSPPAVGLDCSTPTTSITSNQQQAPEVIVPPQPISTDPADVPADELDQQYNEESDILTEAVSAMTTSYSTMITTAVTGYAVQAVDYISPIVIGTGTTLSLGAVGVGIWGWWMGVYHPSRPSPHLPSSRTLWSTAVFGGTSAGMMLLFRSVARSSIRSERKETGASQSTRESDKKSK